MYTPTKIQEMLTCHLQINAITDQLLMNKIRDRNKLYLMKNFKYRDIYNKLFELTKHIIQQHKS